MSKKLVRAGRPPRENSVQSHLIAMVWLAGGKAIKIEGEAGTPDTLVKLPGRAAMLVEVKRPRKKPEPHQTERAKEWIDAGMQATWVSTKREVDLLLMYPEKAEWWSK